jgi:hypothetical protein
MHSQGRRVSNPLSTIGPVLKGRAASGWRWPLSSRQRNDSSLQVNKLEFTSRRLLRLVSGLESQSRATS